MAISCRVCGKPTVKHGYLYSCKIKSCGAVHWNKKDVLKEDLDDRSTLEKVLVDANVPSHLKANKSHFVYVLRLKGETNAVYVGMTGLHPYARYLNHIRGHKSSSIARAKATALIRFEGPMTSDKAVEREVSLAGELRSSGKLVHGGH